MAPAAKEAERHDTSQLDRVVRELEEIRGDLLAAETKFAEAIQQVHDAHRPSAFNLAHYMALRHRDIRMLQEELADFGLSSLGRAEAQVLATVESVIAASHSLAGRRAAAVHHPPRPDLSTGRSLLRQKTTALLGTEPAKRMVRIMVTMPVEAASDYLLVKELVAHGMDLMRINCAHDSPDVWQRIIDNLARARSELSRECRVEMDLAGPKLRTGPLEPGPEVLKIRPRRDQRGRVLEPGRIRLVAAERFTLAGEPGLPVERGQLELLEAGDVLEFKDARNSNRRLIVREIGEGGVVAETRKTAYFSSGTDLRCKRAGGDLKLRVSRLPAIEAPLVLKVGGRVRLSARQRLGHAEEVNDTGELLRPAVLTCTLPVVLRDVQIGEEVWFDDGRIGAVIREAEDGEVELEVTHAAASGSKLGADKGINLPQSRLKLASLTDKDLTDLPFIAQHADIVGYSFVRTQADVEALEANLARLGRKNIGIVLKIETRQAFENLPALLFQVMRYPLAGIMIARGDLAVECGYERLAEVQEEILWMSEAAHLPVIWATQVLESMAKLGLPSRAEITDAAMGERAECVMLNKGPYMVETVAVLDDILRRMQAHQTKKSAMLRRLRW